MRSSVAWEERERCLPIKTIMLNLIFLRLLNLWEGVYLLALSYAKDSMASVFKPGDHGTTFGGNPVACAAAIANLQVIEEENLIKKCQRKRENISKINSKNLKEKYPEKIEEVRGLGLMVGMELKEEGRKS